MKRVRVKVRGIVQGVGFRPFVYRLAQDHGLTGWVRNTSSGVEIEIEGNDVDAFLTALQTEFPPMARIEEVTVSEIAPTGERGFTILESLHQEGNYQLVSPDIATCAECLKEVFAPKDRRFRYPFTNCTNCGPRFTIIEDIPYDRPLTTMRPFRMCPECQKEYDWPLDRRFHAQPNACPACGPRLSLTDAAGNLMPCEDSITAAAQFLSEGKIVAIKGLGGFLLACDATNAGAVRLLRERKVRPGKPFAVMVATLDEARTHCRISPAEAALLKSAQSPIVLLQWRADSTISPEVAPSLRYLGVMLPYTPLHHLLLREVIRPLVMTSGNLSEEPIATRNEEALRRLKPIADCFLLHNRDIHSGYDDSVCLVEQEKPRSIRRARGYAPYPITLPFEATQILACGAEEKNTFCLARERHAFLSQHIGDMENALTLEHFEKTIDLYRRLFRIEPRIIACDMHPEYLSTKYARELVEHAPGLKLVPVQHHHAHIVSCLVENRVSGPVIGVAFDGTGYGTDGTIWGGEFLIADWRGFERVGHFEKVPMPGGAAAIRKPYRMAMGYLTAFGISGLEGLPILGKIDPAEIGLIRQQIERGVNCPLTSSAGRLFDAVAAMAGIRGEITYDAQAAIELEMLATDGSMDSQGYPFSIDAIEGVNVLKLRELTGAVIADIRNGVPAPMISARFHRTIAEIIRQMCRTISRQKGITRVALSGGVFQNRLLLRQVSAMLRKEGFEVFEHNLVPASDGGVSLGQAVVAHFAQSG